ncbi:MAG: putative DNA-binding domain-containing protein [Bacteroidetes bacterium]|nr:putative DNA-binding domain-containing protein [Bacteroidota bacterium]
MQLLNSTQQNQSAFANYCRTGKYSPIKGVIEKRAEHYRSLVYNIIDDTMQSALPLTFNLLTIEEWDRFVNDFFCQHNCRTAQLWRLPLEVHEFVISSNYYLQKKYPFFAELLWFEWLEVELFMMDDKPASFSLSGHILNNPLVINPEFHLQYFSYPIHTKVANDIKKEDKNHHFLALHREPESGKVLFTQLSPLLARMLEILGEGPRSINELLTITEKNKKTKEGVICFFENAIQSKLILGYKN